jgi:hypothetical protein
LLSLRRNDELPDSPIEALTDYFNTSKNPKSGEMDLLFEQVEKLKVENKILADEIEDTLQQIEAKKIEREEAEARRLLEEQEAAKKGPKKTGLAAGPAAGVKKK